MLTALYPWQASPSDFSSLGADAHKDLHQAGRSRDPSGAITRRSSIMTEILRSPIFDSTTGRSSQASKGFTRRRSDPATVNLQDTKASHSGCVV